MEHIWVANLILLAGSLLCFIWAAGLGVVNWHAKRKAKERLEECHLLRLKYHENLALLEKKMNKYC